MKALSLELPRARPQCKFLSDLQQIKDRQIKNRGLGCNLALCTGQSRSHRSTQSAETTPCQSGCQIILKIFLLARIGFFQKLIGIVFFLFELCRLRLRAIKMCHLAERGDSALLHCS